MVDKTIPYKNILMKCDHLNFNSKTTLPKGFYFKMYEEGDEILWAQIEYEIGDFNSYDEALQYFINTYLPKKELLTKRCMFVVDEDNHPVATCTAWYDFAIDDNLVSSLHWFATAPRFQNMGIGKAILSKVLEIYQRNNQLPIYLHTQPWSYKAIHIYSQFGFYLLKKETLKKYRNEFFEAIPILKNLLDINIYHKLIEKAK